MTPGTDVGKGPLELIARLCKTLEAEAVPYCHWKSTTTIDRAHRGEGDLDLLIARSAAQRFVTVLRELGFKEARVATEIPGVFHAYGLDTASGRLVHVHAHYTLVLGDDMSKNYRLPVEGAYLASAAQGAVFREPAPAFELAVLVIRLVLKHAAWDAILIGRGSLTAGERAELADLTQRGGDGVRACVESQLPFIGLSLWEDCLAAVSPRAPAWFRAQTARSLERSLAGFARRSRAADTLLKLSRRVSGFLLRRLAPGRRSRPRLESGGALIAVVGSDAAARSGLAAQLHAWLAKELDCVSVRFEASAARGAAERLALSGALVVCDGYPSSDAADAGRVDPDVVIVLRQSGEPPQKASSTRTLPTLELDAGRPLEAGLAEVKRFVWSSL